MEAFGLRAAGCVWPFMADYGGIDDFHPPTSRDRLSVRGRRRCGATWSAGSKMRAFTRDDPIKLLAHNGTLGAASPRTIQDRLREFPEVDMAETPRLGVAVNSRGPQRAGAITGHPRRGGPVWKARRTPAGRSSRRSSMPTPPAGGATSWTRSAPTASRTTSPTSGLRPRGFERKLHGSASKVNVTFVEVPTPRRCRARRRGQREPGHHDFLRARCPQTRRSMQLNSG